MKKLLLLTYLLVVGCLAYAQLRLPPVFNDHMVIQQQATVPIWGWSNPMGEVRISVSWDTVTVKTKADNTTFWKTAIASPKAGGPHTITIRAGKETRTLQDIMSGEVWLCSGQSNMEWSMAAAGDGKTVMNSVNDPMIRLFQVPKLAANTPQSVGDGQWKPCDAQSVQSFSAVGYFFGKRLQENLHVPIGLINASWGGTPAEVWLPKELIEVDEELKASATKQVDDKPWCPSRPGVVYNAMLSPLIPFRIGGAIWYQGEANTAAPHTYKKLMETLILDWRKEFQSDFPFYYVQIAPFSGYGDIEKGTLIREQEVKMLSIPKTGMVVISDLVDNVKDIHPQYKKPVGERLANVALVQNYGKQGLPYQSPAYNSMKVEKNKIKVFFDYASGGLVTKGGKATEFLIAGEDKKFYPASAKVDGNAVIVSAPEVKKPVAVRFAWSNGSIANLFSKDGLPVSSFRTDDWAIEVP